METFNKWVKLSVEDVLYLLQYVPGMAEVDAERMLRIYATVAKAAEVQIEPDGMTPDYPALSKGLKDHLTMKESEGLEDHVGMTASNEMFRDWLRLAVVKTMQGQAMLYIGWKDETQQKVEAIKIWRSISGVGLKEAKDFVEDGKQSIKDMEVLGRLLKFSDLSLTSELVKFRKFFECLAVIH